jgi:hypothetical protein
VQTDSRSKRMLSLWGGTVGRVNWRVDTFVRESTAKTIETEKVHKICLRMDEREEEGKASERAKGIEATVTNWQQLNAITVS